MSEHTKEPWKYRDIDQSLAGIDDMDDVSIAQTHQRANDKLHVERIANAHRIVACVNALVGIPTEKLQKLFTGDSFVWSGEKMLSLAPSPEVFISIFRQREEMLAALNLIVADIDWQENSPTLRMIKKLITKVEKS